MAIIELLMFQREILFFSEDDRAYASRRETFQKVAEDREVGEAARTRNEGDRSRDGG